MTLKKAAALYKLEQGRIALGSSNKYSPPSRREIRADLRKRVSGSLSLYTIAQIAYYAWQIYKYLRKTYA